ncbi:MAG: hypothetical protein WKH47_03010 [Actinomycetes bacterium]
MGPDATTHPALADLGRPLDFMIELCDGEDVALLLPGDAAGGVVVAYLAGP